METEFIFVPSAFKHGVTKEDIYHAYKTIIFKGLLEGYDNKYAFVGFNRAGNPIEVLDLFGNSVSCRTSPAKYCVFCCFIRKLFGELKFPNNSIRVLHFP